MEIRYDTDRVERIDERIYRFRDANGEYQYRIFNPDYNEYTPTPYWWLRAPINYDSSEQLHKLIEHVREIERERKKQREYVESKDAPDENLIDEFLGNFHIITDDVEGGD